MADTTLTADKSTSVASSVSDPTQDQNQRSLKYSLSNITVASNSTYIIRCEYEKNYKEIPDISVAYDFDLDTSDELRILPQTTTIDSNYFEVTINNLKTSSVTVSNMEMCISY